MNSESIPSSSANATRSSGPKLLASAVLALGLVFGLSSPVAFAQAFNNEASVSADQFDPDLSDNTDDGSDGNNGADAIVEEIVFLDNNGNGVVDPGEELAGIDVDFTVGGTTVTVTTDANGVATVVALDGDTVTIDIDDTTLPAGSVLSVGTDPTDVTAVGGTTVNDTTGYEQPTTVTETVFNDLNGNGVLDPGEALAGVDVDFTVGGVTTTVTTDASGVATFTGAGAGDTVTIDIDDMTLPAGSVLSVGTDPTDVTAVGGTTVNDTTGYEQPEGTVAGIIYEDSNGNGVQDPGEPGIPGVEIIITDSDGMQQTATTDADGNYSAPVPPGDTLLDIDESTLPPGFTQTQGTDPTMVTVPVGGIANDVDGFEPPPPMGAVTGTIYQDTNGNGVQDPGEPGIAGVEVVVTDSEGNMQTVTTDGSGNYSATVPPGDTTLDIVEGTLPAGVTQTQGTDPTTVSVPVDGVANDIDGFEPAVNSGTVTGVIYEDTNGNGTQDPGEPGIPGVEVVITDSDGNMQTVTTDGNGGYSATVPAGDTTIDVNESTLPGGSTQTEGTDPTVVNVPPGGTASDVDGYEPAADSGTVTGVIYEDTNGNGTQDPGEPGIEGVVVIITDSQGGVQTVVTDSDGNYTATVPPGDTTLDINESTLPGGVTQTEGSDPTVVTVPAGGTENDVDGFEPPVDAGTVSGTIYEDTNGNGTQDPGEPGIPGVEVVITDSDGNMQTVTTDGDGDYSATVPPGDTVLDIDQGTLPPGSTQTEGDDPTVVTVPPGGTATDVDGFEPPVDAGTVTGTIYEDTNGNGMQDPGEPGLPGVDVVITDSDGNMQTVTTDTDGTYMATVPPGDTTVDIDDMTLPGGSTQTEGDDPTVVTVPPGGTATDVDGFEPPVDAGTVTGTIYEDTNGNGTQDPGEPGIPGVDVVITDSDGNMQTVTTDTDGTYMTTVPPGDTTIDIDDMTLPVGSTQTEGDDPTTVVVPPNGTVSDIDGYEPAPANNPPVAVDDIETTPLDTPVSIPVLDNDSDPDGDPLEIGTFTQPTNGTVTQDPGPDGILGTPDDELVYTPNPGFTGVDTFMYEACEAAVIMQNQAVAGSGKLGQQSGPVNCVTATVTVTVIADTEPPVAEPDFVSTGPGVPVTIVPLTNDSDDQGLDPSSVVLIDPITGDPVATVTIPGQGTYVVNPDGTITFTPDPGFTGTSTVDYQVADEAGNTTTSTITVFIPNAPQAIPTVSEWAMLLMIVLLAWVASRELQPRLRRN